MTLRSIRSINRTASLSTAFVDVRYGMRSIILTSNRAMSDLMSVFPDPVIAGAILDRLAHQAHQIQLKGESVRKKVANKHKDKSL